MREIHQVYVEDKKRYNGADEFAMEQMVAFIFNREYASYKGAARDHLPAAHVEDNWRLKFVQAFEDATVYKGFAPYLSIIQKTLSKWKAEDDMKEDAGFLHPESDYTPYNGRDRMCPYFLRLDSKTLQQKIGMFNQADFGFSTALPALQTGFKTCSIADFHALRHKLNYYRTGMDPLKPSNTEVFEMYFSTLLPDRKFDEATERKKRIGAIKINLFNARAIASIDDEYPELEAQKTKDALRINLATRRSNGKPVEESDPELVESFNGEINKKKIALYIRRYGKVLPDDTDHQVVDELERQIEQAKSGVERGTPINGEAAGYMDVLRKMKIPGVPAKPVS
jgi:hypothetical protein